MEQDEKKKNGRVVLIAVVAIVVIAAVVIAVLLGGGGKEDKKAKKPSGVTEGTVTPAQTTAPTDVPEATVTSEPTKAPLQGKSVPFQAGDYVSFGSYVPGGVSAKDTEGEIEWQIAEATDGGIVLVSTKILAVRAFDCAESGTFDVDKNGEVYDWDKMYDYTPLQMMEFRGSNHWESSDMRTWLNANGAVRYPGALPSDVATDEGNNAWGEEPGFLTGFAKEEVSLIASSGYGVYLLTIEEVDKYDRMGTLAVETDLTEAAVEANQSSWYQKYKESGAKGYIWATSTAATGSACEIYHVNTTLSEKVFNSLYAAASRFGVRPAIHIFPREEYWEGDGSSADPYRLVLK